MVGDAIVRADPAEAEAGESRQPLLSTVNLCDDGLRLDVHLSMLLVGLLPAEQAIRQEIATGAEAWFDCSWQYAGGPAGPVLEPATLTNMSSLDARLVFELEDVRVRQLNRRLDELTPGSRDSFCREGSPPCE